MSDRARIFIDTLKVNINSDKLTDSEFRMFVRNSLVQFNPPGKRTHEHTDSSSTYLEGDDNYIGPYGSGVDQNDR